MKHSRKQSGLPPGSVVFTGDRKVDQLAIHYLQYNDKHLQDMVLDSHMSEELSPTKDGLLDWYDLRGIHDAQWIEALGKTFEIHSLVLEGIADVHQRPKFQEFDKGNSVTLKAVAFDKAAKEITSEHVTIYFRPGFVATFQESGTDLFAAVRKRVKSASGRIHQRDSDYLTYALIDEIVDNYFVVLDDVEEVIEGLEDRLLSSQDIRNKGEIHDLKKQLMVLRKSVAPLREAISRFSKSESEYIHDSTRIFVRDLYDHTIQVVDSIENYRDMLNGLQDLFLSEVSFKMNQVIQVLTIISAIFIPLTFLAGLYGMNFENIPELHYKNGYFVLLGVMAVMAIALVIFFKRKRWL
ncbi:MAG: magnesium/cobalt transporter CorA [Saprospiraceae bacterium]